MEEFDVSGCGPDDDVCVRKEATGEILHCVWHYHLLADDFGAQVEAHAQWEMEVSDGVTSLSFEDWLVYDPDEAQLEAWDNAGRPGLFADWLAIHE